MKKISFGLNILLILAVAGIYVIHFLGDRTKEGGVVDSEAELVIDREYAIAYVDIDTLVSQYDSFIDKREELTQKRNESEAELQIKSKDFENEVRDFQNQVNKGLITRTKAQVLQQELAQKEQQLYVTRDNMLRELTEEEQVMYRKVLDEVMAYLEEYNIEYNYKYIFSKSFGGQLLFTDKSLNITSDVLNGLNEKYGKEKGK